MKISRGVLIAATIIFATQTWAGCQKIQFKKNMSATLIEGVKLNGAENMQYCIGVSQNQTMTIHVTSPEQNAVFDVALPNDQGALNGAAPSDEVNFWRGKLPQSGVYRLNVGSVRGNATYQLYVAVE